MSAEHPHDLWVAALEKALARWDMRLHDEDVRRFRVYLDELARWNERINLTALTQPMDIALGHFADSLAAMSVEAVFRQPAARAVDVGTGAGFPGFPLKIMNPGWQVTLIDSIGKKCDFLRAMVPALGVTGVEVLCARSEDAGHDPAHRERYDLAFARALSGLSTLIEYAFPLLKVGGLLVAHRGRTAADEITRVDAALQELGGAVEGLQHYDIPELGGSRALVMIRKTTPTSKHYPRRTGVAAKRPL